MGNQTAYNQTAYSEKENLERQMNGHRYDNPITEIYKSLPYNNPSTEVHRLIKPIHPIQSFEDIRHSTFKSMRLNYEVADSTFVSNAFLIGGDEYRANCIRLYSIAEENNLLCAFLKRYNDYYYVFIVDDDPFVQEFLQKCDAFIAVSSRDLMKKQLTEFTTVTVIDGFMPRLPYMTLGQFKHSLSNVNRRILSINSKTLKKMLNIHQLLNIRIDLNFSVYIIKTNNNIVYEKTIKTINIEDPDEMILIKFDSTEEYLKFKTDCETALDVYYTHRM